MTFGMLDFEGGPLFWIGLALGWIAGLLFYAGYRWWKYKQHLKRLAEIDVRGWMDVSSCAEIYSEELGDGQSDDDLRQIKPD